MTPREFFEKNFEVLDEFTEQLDKYAFGYLCDERGMPQIMSGDGGNFSVEFDIRRDLPEFIVKSFSNWETFKIGEYEISFEGYYEFMYMDEDEYYPPTLEFNIKKNGENFLSKLDKLPF